MAEGASRRVAVDLPSELFDRAERATQELSMNRNELIRHAVEQFLEAIQQAKLERELAEGYQANAALDRKVADEFAPVDYGSR